MVAVPERVEWKLVVDSEGAVKEMKLVGKDAENVDKQMEKTKSSSKDASGGLKELASSFGGLKNMIGMAMGAVGISGFAFGLEDIIKTTSTVSEETLKFQKTTGMGAQSSLDYVAALKALGLSSETVTKGYSSLGKAVEAAERQQTSYSMAAGKAQMRGTLLTTQIGSQAEAFERLGINLATFKDLKPEKQFEVLTDKFTAMSAGAEKANLATMIFGRAGKALLPYLSEGSESLSHFFHMAKEFFPSIKGEGAQAMEELRVKTIEGKMAWEGLEFTLGMKLAPILSTVMGWFSKLIGEIEKGHGVWGTLESDLGSVIGVGESVYDWLKKTPVAVYALGTALGVLGAAFAVEKVVQFLNTLRSLFLVTKLVSGFQALAGAVKMFGAAEVTTAAETAAAGAAETAATGEAVAGGAAMAGGAAASGGMASMLGPLGIAAALGPAAFMGGDWLGKHKGRSIEKTIGEGAGDIANLLGFGGHHISNREEAANRLYAEQGRALGVPGITEPGRLPVTAGGVGNSHQGQHTFQINIDGKRIGEVIALNAQAMRFITEGVERASLYRNARGPGVTAW